MPSNGQKLFSTDEDAETEQQTSSLMLKENLEKKEEIKDNNEVNIVESEDVSNIEKNLEEVKNEQSDMISLKVDDNTETQLDNIGDNRTNSDKNMSSQLSEASVSNTANMELKDCSLPNSENLTKTDELPLSSNDEEPWNLVESIIRTQSLTKSPQKQQCGNKRNSPQKKDSKESTPEKVNITSVADKSSISVNIIMIYLKF